MQRERRDLAEARGLKPGAWAILQALDEAFERKSWHGTNLHGSIRGLSPERAAWRPGPGRHNIWENVVHAAYWKYAARRRLLGEKRGSFALKGSNWFARPEGDASESSWRADVALLVAEHGALRRAVDAWASGRDAGVLSQDEAAHLLIGIAFHDIYHAGQIQLVKRLNP